MARIEHFAIFAQDIEIAKRFFVEALELRVIVDNSRAAIPGYFLADDHGVALEIIERAADVPVADTRHVCHTAFAVDSVELTRGRLEQLGAVFESETAIDDPEFKTAFCRDLAGNRVQIVWRNRPLGG